MLWGVEIWVVQRAFAMEKWRHTPLSVFTQKESKIETALQCKIDLYMDLYFKIHSSRTWPTHTLSDFPWKKTCSIENLELGSREMHWSNYICCDIWIGERHRVNELIELNAFAIKPSSICTHDICASANQCAAYFLELTERKKSNSHLVCKIV